MGRPNTRLDGDAAVLVAREDVARAIVEAVVLSEGGAEVEALELAGLDDAAEDHGVVERALGDDGTGAGVDGAPGGLGVGEGLVDVVPPNAEAFAFGGGAGVEEPGPVVADGLEDEREREPAPDELAGDEGLAFGALVAGVEKTEDALAAIDDLTVELDEDGRPTGDDAEDVRESVLVMGLADGLVA